MPELSLTPPPAPAWDAVERELSGLIQELRSAVPTYSYADDAAAPTDEQLCTYLMAELRAAKHALLPVVDRAFSLAGRTGTSAYREFEHAAQLLRDDLDILSDEIKLRSFAWSPLSADWLRMLVRKDHELLAGLHQLRSSVGQLASDVAQAGQPGAPALADAGFWPALAAHVQQARQQLSGLVRTLKERENICNLRKFEFAKTMEQIQRAAR